jgi:hypothetical protein
MQKSHRLQLFPDTTTIENNVLHIGGHGLGRLAVVFADVQIPHERSFMMRRGNCGANDWRAGVRNPHDGIYAGHRGNRASRLGSSPAIGCIHGRLEVRLGNFVAFSGLEAVERLFRETKRAAQPGCGDRGGASVLARP